MESFFLFLLIAIAVGPLMLLGLYVLADYFGLKMAGRMLDALAGLLKFQWLAGSALNIVGGLAISALGGWFIWHSDALPQRLAGALLVPFGLWRTCRGAVFMSALLRRRTPR